VGVAVITLNVGISTKFIEDGGVWGGVKSPARLGLHAQVSDGGSGDGGMTTGTGMARDFPGTWSLDNFLRGGTEKKTNADGKELISDLLHTEQRVIEEALLVIFTQRNNGQICMEQNM
jgi:hypothetical protein